MRLHAIAAIAVVFSASGAAQGQDGARLALLIGNQDYPAEVGALSLPHQDVSVLNTSLLEAGFTVRIIRDADEDAMTEAIADFADRLDEAGEGATGFFYYSGHGASTEVGGRRRNYLMPAEETITNPRELQLRGVRLDEVIDVLAGTGAETIFVVSDACRNALRWAGDRGRDRGFAPAPSRPGMFIALSTAEDATAPDDGLFAEALARQLRAPGLFAGRAFELAFREVAESRADYRLPTAAAALREDFCFISCPGETVSSPSPRPVEALDPAGVLWAVIGTGEDAAALQALIDRYPESRYADQARARLAELAEAAADPFGPGAVFADPLSSGGVGPEMVVVPAGEFLMGAPSGERGRQDNESPQSAASVLRNFALSAAEITFDDWAACVAGGGCGGNPNPDDLGWGRGQRPVINVSWSDAMAYVEWLSAVTGERYQLPDETHWEYAARAGTSTAYHTGDMLIPSDANFAWHATWDLSYSERAPDQTLPVRSFPPNAFGLYDMHGNVYEWTAECSRFGSGATANQCTDYFVKGGAWNRYPAHLRAAARLSIPADAVGIALGFRVMRRL